MLTTLPDNLQRRDVPIPKSHGTGLKSIANFTYSQSVLSLDMKTKLVEYATRLNPDPDGSTPPFPLKQWINTKHFRIDSMTMTASRHDRQLGIDYPQGYIFPPDIRFGYTCTYIIFPTNKKKVYWLFGCFMPFLEYFFLQAYLIPPKFKKVHFPP